MDKEVFHISIPKKTSLVVDSTVFNSITDYDLSKEEMEKACLELGESDLKKERCLQELKRKLSKDENVHYRTDDFFLLRFLRVRKFDCDRAYQNMKQFYSLKKKRADFFNIPPNLKTVLDKNILTILPYTDEDGRIILWMDFENWNIEEISCDEMLRAAFTIFDVISMNPKCQVNGMMGVWGMKGLTRSHITEFFRKNRLLPYLSFVQHCYPWRVKLSIPINIGRLSRLLYQIIRPILTKKIRDRLVILGSDLNELHQYINPAILPKKLGGQLDDGECSVTDLVLNNLPYLEYERSFISD